MFLLTQYCLYLKLSLPQLNLATQNCSHCAVSIAWCHLLTSSPVSTTHNHLGINNACHCCVNTYYHCLNKTAALPALLHSYALVYSVTFYKLLCTVTLLLMMQSSSHKCKKLIFFRICRSAFIAFLCWIQFNNGIGGSLSYSRMFWWFVFILRPYFAFYWQFVCAYVFAVDVYVSL